LTVVQLRVLRKSNKIETGKTIYKVHIKRTYKVSKLFPGWLVSFLTIPDTQNAQGCYNFVAMYLKVESRYLHAHKQTPVFS